jgi:hypothetical protein
MKSDSFEINFRGNTTDGINYDSGLRITGNMETIGRLFAEYALEAARQGQQEPLRILIAAFERMRQNSEGDPGKIIKPIFN